ncbi:hypothetical protein [Aureibacter tunicatorum]|uniref:Uncharacterized protein n=1 Tax=Aureibacter tunicatorum TaxID=866807 RepID=A0AAE4BSD4_9BACT|nr:hypothetical protein [Aureibacter tunicatorum]MDR6238738.1 hypothetical protein [Aureibacter tunicatorum]BDD05331.1 hypothetical protein AUTU_28140 [Aureibacter tunicatorum]
MFQYCGNKLSRNKSNGVQSEEAIQCYRVMPPDSYRVFGDVNFKSHGFYDQEYVACHKEFFSSESQSFEKHFHLAGDIQISEQPKATKPELKVSDSYDLAVALPPFAHNFFASSEMIMKSNRVLEDMHANVKLVVKNGGLLVRDVEGVEHELMLVEPERVGGGELSVESECIFFMHDVLGIKHGKHLVARLADRNDVDREFEFHDREPADRLVAGLCKSIAKGEAENPDFIHRKRKIAGEYGECAPELKQSLESLSSSQRERVAENLGIDRHASPIVGEGIATYSGDEFESSFFRAKPPKYTDFESMYRYHMEAGTAKNRLEVLFFPWQFQFGAVVAKSGEDFITIENVHQYSEMMSKVSVDFFKLYENNRLLKMKVKKLTGGMGPLGVRKWKGDLFSYLEKLIPYLIDSRLSPSAVGELETMWAKKISLCKAPPHKLFFVNMYGKEEGHSFHELYEDQIASPAFTLVVRDSMEKWKISEESEMEKALNAYLKICPELNVSFMEVSTLVSRQREGLRESLDRHRQLLKLEKSVEGLKEIKEGFVVSVNLSSVYFFRQLYDSLQLLYSECLKERLGEQDRLDDLYQEMDRLARRRAFMSDGHDLEKVKNFMHKYLDYLQRNYLV